MFYPFDLRGTAEDLAISDRGHSTVSVISHPARRYCHANSAEFTIHMVFAIAELFIVH